MDPAAAARAITPSEAPPLSTAERDRRWNAVRGLLEREQADALVIAGPSATRADLRYLSHAPAWADAPQWMVFPRAGVPQLIARPGHFESSPSAWIANAIEVAVSPGGTVIEVLRTLRVPNRRIAIAGLAGDDDWASVPAGFVAGLREAMPGIELVDLGQSLRSLRAIKSEEEIGVLAHAASLLDAAYAQIDRVARPGLTAHELWAAGVGELCRLGSELSTHNRWASAARPRALARPAHGVLPSGHIVACELEAVVAGYATRAIHARAIGPTGPVLPALYAIVGELWEHTIAAVQPGTALRALERELRTRTSRLVAPHGPLKSASAWLTLQGSGLGADLPALSGTSTGKLNDQPIEIGWVCSLGIALRADAEGRQYVASWSDPIVVTTRGSARLGARPPGSFPTG